MVRGKCEYRTREMMNVEVNVIRVALFESGLS